MAPATYEVLIEETVWHRVVVDAVSSIEAKSIAMDKLCNTDDYSSDGEVTGNIFVEMI